jgi:hypothetical protein
VPDGTVVGEGCPGGEFVWWGDPRPGVGDSFDRVAVSGVDADKDLREFGQVAVFAWADGCGHQSSTRIV